MKIIIVVGMPGSGKTVAAKFIAKKFRAYFISTGDIIRAEIKKRGWKYTPETSRKMRDWFRAGREQLIIKRVWKKIKNKKLVVIDGFRSYKELQTIKKISKVKPTVIAITANFKVRAEREQKRGRFKGRETIDYLKKRDKAETRLGLKRLIKNSDFKVNNSKLTKKQTQTKLVDLIKEVI